MVVNDVDNIGNAYGDQICKRNVKDPVYKRMLTTISVLLYRIWFGSFFQNLLHVCVLLILNPHEWAWTSITTRSTYVQFKISKANDFIAHNNRDK